jgi:hypothetical protein
LSSSKKSYKPGEAASIIVETTVNSVVGLLAIDESVLILREGNDIKPEDVFKSLHKDDEIFSVGSNK